MPSSESIVSLIKVNEVGNVFEADKKKKMKKLFKQIFLWAKKTTMKKKDEDDEDDDKINSLSSYSSSIKPYLCDVVFQNGSSYFFYFHLFHLDHHPDHHCKWLLTLQIFMEC